MVVIVSGAGTQEAKTPNRKLNPLRTSIDDKIRSDFCPKHPGLVISFFDSNVALTMSVTWMLPFDWRKRTDAMRICRADVCNDDDDNITDVSELR